MNWLGVPEAGEGGGEAHEQEEARVAQVEALLAQSPQLNSATAELMLF